MEKASTPRELSSEYLVRAHWVVRTVAEPWTPGDSVKAAIRRASDLLGISFRRAKSFWYCEPSAILAAEMAHLESAYAATLRRRSSYLRAESQLVAARIAALEETHDESVARAVAAAVGGARALANGGSDTGHRPSQPQSDRGGSGQTPDAYALDLNPEQ